MSIVKCLLLLLMFSAPLFTGFAVNKDSFIEAYLYGQLLLWAIFQLLAVPLVFFRIPFSCLWISYAFVMLILVLLGIRNRKNQTDFRIRVVPEKPITDYIPLVLALCLILFQAGMYAVGMHLDEDDSRFVAEAGDALAKNTMYLHNPATGEYIGRFVGEMRKDVFSPWAMYLAVLSRLTMMQPAVIAHTVYPPILLLLCYMAYWLMSMELFPNRFERGAFLLSAAVIHLFFSGARHTQAATVLSRIWQGKAVVAAVLIPVFLLLLLRIEREDSRQNWLWLGVSGCAACLVSGVGVATSAIMVAIYGGYAVLCGRWRRIPYLLLALLPSLTFGLLYFRWR